MPESKDPENASVAPGHIKAFSEGLFAWSHDDLEDINRASLFSTEEFQLRLHETKTHGGKI